MVSDCGAEWVIKSSRYTANGVLTFRPLWGAKHPVSFCTSIPTSSGSSCDPDWVMGKRRHSVDAGGGEFAHVSMDDRSRLGLVRMHADERKDSAVSFQLAAVAHYEHLGVKIKRQTEASIGLCRDPQKVRMEPLPHWIEARTASSA